VGEETEERGTRMCVDLNLPVCVSLCVLFVWLALGKERKRALRQLTAGAGAGWA